MTAFLTAVVAQSPASLRGRRQRMAWLRRQLNAIKRGGTNLFVLPELFLSGYNIGDRLIDEAIQPSDATFAEIARLAQAHETAILFGYPEKRGNRLYNSASCVSKSGRLLGTHRKLVFPPGFERDYFSSGASYATFDLAGFTVGTLICYDAEFPENFRRLAAADLVVVPTALTTRWGVVSEKVMPARAFENGVFICYANHVGVENGLGLYGGSCIIAPDGDELARAKKDEPLISATLNKDMVLTMRTQMPYLRDRFNLPA